MDNFKINMNKQISKIMSNDTFAVMLFAPAGTGKTDFLTELSNRYKTVFWFNALTDNVESFSLCLAEKIFRNNPDMMRKVRQIRYCESSINNEIVIITAILQYISTIKGNCLLVFERMERLPKNFDYSLIERLIKHCPKNLKIVISSDSFINFDYNRFEPMYPILIDENILGQKPPRPDFDAYIEEFDDEQKAFLVYVADLDYLDKDFLNTFYPQGVDMLERLCCKERFVATRDIKFYRMNTLLRNWLFKQKQRYSAHLKKFSDIDVRQRLGDYLLKEEKYYEAFKIFHKAGFLDKIETSLKGIVKNKSLRLELYSYSKYYENEILECVKDCLYYRLYLAFYAYVHKNYELCYMAAKELADEFKEDKDARLCCHSLMLKSKTRMGKFKEAYELLKELKPIYEHNISDYEEIVSLMPIIYRELDMPIDFNEVNKLEYTLDEKPENKAALWYPKVKQAISEAYFDTGNYKKAMQITRRIKEVIPFYVIPHKLIMFYYYSGDIESAYNIANSALRFAIKHDITRDLSMLYTALANIDMFYGRVKDALEKFDKAVSLDKENSYTKFYNISQRCMAYARYGDMNYAKEVSHIYLKYCEKYAPQYANMMLCALAFSYYKLKNYEQAYFYATKCVTQSKSRSIFWLSGMAIATSYLLERNDLKDAHNLVKNILKSSYIYGMETMVADSIDIFENLLNFAHNNYIETEYVERIRAMVKKKESMKQVNHNLRIRFFGSTAVYSGNTEIQWKTKKAKELFLHYILAGKDGIDRNIIIENLWKDYVYESAINNLKTTNNIIRKTLESNDVDFELSYINSKYILHINNVVNDYDEFRNMIELYKIEENLENKKTIMNKLIDKFREGFAVEIKNQDFNRHRDYILQEMIIMLLQLISDLKKKEDFIEAKKYLTYLKQIDTTNDYKKLTEEINSLLS